MVASTLPFSLCLVVCEGWISLYQIRIRAWKPQWRLNENSGLQYRTKWHQTRIISTLRCGIEDDTMKGSSSFRRGVAGWSDDRVQISRSWPNHVDCRCLSHDGFPRFLFSKSQQRFALDMRDAEDARLAPISVPENLTYTAPDQWYPRPPLGGGGLELSLGASSLTLMHFATS